MSNTTQAVDPDWKSRFPPFAVHFNHDEPVYLEATGEAGVASVPYQELPLIVPPETRIEFLGKSFLLEREGLHVLIEGCYRRRNVIVYGSDEIALFRALAQIQIHSEESDKTTYEEKLECAKRGALPITCGSIANFTRQLVAEHGIRCRRISISTLDEWNGYDNGHALLEYLHAPSGNWRLLDIDTHSLIMKNGRFLNLDEFHETIRANETYEIFCLSEIGKFDDRSVMMPWCFIEIGTESGLRRWFARVFQMAAIREETSGQAVWSEDDPERRQAFLALSPKAKIVPKSEWRKMFYGK
jgi:hypothetical protein